MPERARLLVNGEGEVEVDYVVTFLADLQNAYNSILVFEIILGHVGDWPFSFEPILGNAAALIRRGPRRGVQLVGDWPPTPDKIATMIPDAERLVLT